MKEIRFFYAPNIAETHELPTDEASHALRVLRLNVGDEVYVLDGKGNIIKAIISKISGKHCLLDIQSVAKTEIFLQALYVPRRAKRCRAG